MFCFAHKSPFNKANDTLEKKCSIACADAGYDNTDEFKKIDD